jgi:hypothetical protein
MQIIFEAASCHDAKVCGEEEEGGRVAPKRMPAPRSAGPLLSCIFSAIINDAALRPLLSDIRPPYHFRPLSSLSLERGAA